MTRSGYINRLIGCLLSLYSVFADAFSWQDLWQNADSRAQKLMQQGRYAEAQKQFKRDDWRATAAFRAGNYPQASALFSTLNHTDGYYNAGNAYAYQGQYEKAIQAYNKALAINHQNQDAIDNRRIVEDLLKKQQSEQQKKQSQDKQTQNQSDQNKQNSKQPASSSNQPHQTQPQPKQSTQNQQEAQPSPQDKTQQRENKTDSNDQSNQKEQNKDKKDQDKSEQSPKDAQSNQPAASKEASKQNSEQQGTDQWLNMIPDDPGGLLREKFLRDYLRRRGES